MRMHLAVKYNILLNFIARLKQNILYLNLF